jgi:hypothetical protein
MPQTSTPVTIIRSKNGGNIALQPVTSLLSPRTRALLRTLEKERHARPNRVLRGSRSHCQR